MNKVVLTALVMTTLLVVDTEGGWFRSKWESFKTKVKTASRSLANPFVQTALSVCLSA